MARPLLVRFLTHCYPQTQIHICRKDSEGPEGKEEGDRGYEMDAHLLRAGHLLSHVQGPLYWFSFNQIRGVTGKFKLSAKLFLKTFQFSKTMKCKPIMIKPDFKGLK